MGDDNTTIMDIRRMMAEFIAEREWVTYHTPKNIAISMCIEAAELLENFQWEEYSISDIKNNEKIMANIRDEVADVFLYLCSMCNTLDIDLSDAVCAKLEKNRKKYPAELYKGRAYLDR